LNIDYVHQLIILLGIGGTGAYIGYLFKIPAGVLIGSLITVGLFQIFFGIIMEKPDWMKLAMQIIVGLIVGSRFTKEMFVDFEKLIKPIIISCATYILVALALGTLLSHILGWDILSCILSTTPGGQTEMILLSESLNAQTEKVIVVHIVRNQFVLLCLMPLTKLLKKISDREEVNKNCKKKNI
jgi:hypothetical protein